MNFGGRAKSLLALSLILTLITFVSGLNSLAATSPEEPGSAKGVIVEEVVPQSRFNVTVSTDKTRYAIGELMHITVRSEKSGYLTLYDIQPNGKVNLLFPNYYRSDQRIEANKTFQIPAPQDFFRFRVGPPKGRDVLWAIVSNKPGTFPIEKATEGSPFPQVSEDPDKFAKSVKGVTVEQKKGWGAGYSVFYIGQPLGGHINVKSSPPGASIYLNGSYRGKSPMTIYDLKAGSYKLGLKMEGFQNWTRTIQIQAGSTQRVNANLTPLAPTINSVSVTPTPSVEGQQVQFKAQASDPGQDQLTYNWQIAGANYTGPSLGVTFNDDAQISWNLTVTDGDGGTTQTSGTHTVEVKEPTKTTAYITVPNEGKVMKTLYGVMGFQTIIRDLKTPHGLACSESGHLYVAETGANRIKRFDQGGGGEALIAELKESPLSLTFGPRGNLFFTTKKGNIWKLGQNGSLGKIVPKESLVKGIQVVNGNTFPGEESPYDLAFLKKGKFAGDMIVSLDAPNYGQVVRLPAPNFNQVKPFINTYVTATDDGGTRRMNLRTPTGLAVSRKGEVFVGEFAQSASRILRYSSGGRFIEVFTRNVSRPNGLEIDWHERLYATTASFAEGEAVSGTLRRYVVSSGRQTSPISRFGCWGIAICEE